MKPGVRHCQTAMNRENSWVASFPRRRESSAIARIRAACVSRLKPLVAGCGALGPASYCQRPRNRRAPMPHTLLQALRFAALQTQMQMQTQIQKGRNPKPYYYGQTAEQSGSDPNSAPLDFPQAAGRSANWALTPIAERTKRNLLFLNLFPGKPSASLRPCRLGPGADFWAFDSMRPPAQVCMAAPTPSANIPFAPDRSFRK